MKRSALILSALVISASLAISAAHAAEPHTHEPGAATTAELQLDNGRKWATDAPLRRGMSEIRNLLARAPRAVHAGTAKPEAYAALGSRIETAVARIVAECKLEPKADAMLHLVIADVLGGAQAMKAPQPGESARNGLLRVAAALDAYDKHFDHPGWQPLAH